MTVGELRGLLRGLHGPTKLAMLPPNNSLPSKERWIFESGSRKERGTVALRAAFVLNVPAWQFGPS